MTILAKQLDHHIIYGTWDDVINDQFLVFYHPNGKDCTVFGMNGIDYGGGVDWIVEMESKHLDNIVESSPDAYTAKQAIHRWGTQNHIISCP